MSQQDRQDQDQAASGAGLAAPSPATEGNTDMADKQKADAETVSGPLNVAPAPTSAEVIDPDKARSDGRSEALAYVREVNDLCALAGMPDRASDFIAADAPVATVRAALLEAHAKRDEATAIAGQHHGNVGTPADASAAAGDPPAIPRSIPRQSPGPARATGAEVAQGAGWRRALRPMIKPRQE